MPDFCYNCGIIGHSEKACPTRTKREGGRQYGPWLRAVINKGSSSEERNRGLSNKSEFWSGGSKGSRQGSDGPSWRKTSPSAGDDCNKKGVEKEAASPLKITREEHIETAGGNEPVSIEKLQNTQTEGVQKEMEEKHTLNAVESPKEKEIKSKETATLGDKEARNTSLQLISKEKMITFKCQAGQSLTND